MKNIMTLANFVQFYDINVNHDINVIPERLFNLIITRIPKEKLNLLLLPSKKKSIPNDVDMRNKMPPIVDQGNLGSCTANALCALVSFLNPKMIGSRLFLYYNEREIQGTVTSDTGAYLHDGVHSLVKNGICHENDWPYIIKLFAVKPSPICYTKALDNQALVVKNIKNDLVSMKNALKSGFPFVVGILIYESFMTDAVATSGNVPMPAKNEKILGGHALCVVGYNDTNKVFIVRNSWGTGWGDKGYCYIPYTYLSSRKYTSDLWCITKVEL
jgi:C1A family cysteine protease